MTFRFIRANWKAFSPRLSRTNAQSCLSHFFGFDFGVFPAAPFDFRRFFHVVADEFSLNSADVIYPNSLVSTSLVSELSIFLSKIPNVHMKKVCVDWKVRKEVRLRKSFVRFRLFKQNSHYTSEQSQRSKTRRNPTQQETNSTQHFSALQPFK